MQSVRPEVGARGAVRESLPVDFPVTLEVTPDGPRQVGSVVDVGPGGLFVAARALVPAGTMLRVSLVLPLAGGPKTLAATARVDWVNDPSAPRAPELPAGMGIEFVGLEPEARASLRALLDELVAPGAGPS